jgi:hypothetical protein
VPATRLRGGTAGSGPGPRWEDRRPVKARKGKRRKGMVKWLMEEAFDALEDIFD